MLLVAILLLAVTNCHKINNITQQKLSISVYVNQGKQYPIPFGKCFKVQTALPLDQQYLSFEPSSLELLLKKKKQLTIEKDYSLLERLRSPYNTRSKKMVLLQGLVVMFTLPNIISIISETEDGFSKETVQRKIDNISHVTHFQMFGFQKDKVMIFFERTNKTLMITKDKTISMEITAYEHMLDFIELGPDSFVTAEGYRGLKQYRINKQQQKIEVVKNYSQSFFPIDPEKVESRSIYISDIDSRDLQSRGVLYVLDTRAGLFELRFNESDVNQYNATLIINNPGCHSFDFFSKTHLIMLCYSDGYSSILEYVRDTQQSQFNLIKTQYSINYLLSVKVFHNFYLSFLQNQILVYWSAKQNNLPQEMETMSRISIAALETFAFKIQNQQIYIYTVESGILNKYQMKESKPKLIFRSDQPVSQKVVTIVFDGSCKDLQMSGQIALPSSVGSEVIETCRIRREIELSFSQEQQPHKEDVGISIMIVVILLLVFTMIIWICFKKYKGLEKQARKVLENYKKRKNQNQRRAI